MNFNYRPCNVAILSYNKMFTALDLLYILQNDPKKQQILSSAFFSKKYNVLIKDFQPLDEDSYNKLYLFLLMHNEKFFYVTKAYHTFHSYNIFNIKTNWVPQYKSILLDYLYHKYNLPTLSTNEKDDASVIEGDIIYLRNYQVLMDHVYKLYQIIKTFQSG